MKALRNFTAAILLLSLLMSSEAIARSGGGFAFGGNVGFINSDQKDFNKEVEARKSVTGAGTFGNAWEFNAFLSYKMQGGVELMLRPSYFMYQDEEGTAATYALTGFTIFPMLKSAILESNTVAFYYQVGVGYGQMWGEISDAGQSVEFSGGSIGYLFGLGAEFCWFGNHCFNFEGNLRILEVDRMNVDATSGGFNSSNLTGTTITQSAKDGEFEQNGRDFGASMSGILGMVGYVYRF